MRLHAARTELCLCGHVGDQLFHSLHESEEVFKMVAPACLEYSQAIHNPACMVTCQAGDGNGGRKKVNAFKGGRTNIGRMVSQAKKHKDFAFFPGSFLDGFRMLFRLRCLGQFEKNKFLYLFPTGERSAMSCTEPPASSNSSGETCSQIHKYWETHEIIFSYKKDPRTFSHSSWKLLFISSQWHSKWPTPSRKKEKI